MEEKDKLRAAEQGLQAQLRSDVLVTLGTSTAADVLPAAAAQALRAPGLPATNDLRTLGEPAEQVLVPLAAVTHPPKIRYKPTLDVPEAVKEAELQGRVELLLTIDQEGLVTHIEIVLSKDEGRIVRLGVTRASGSTAFDAVAINSVSRASPFGKAPDVIVSPDGNVYLHWEFHRDPYDACTTRNARPFLLKSAPTPKPTPRLPLPGRSSDERREVPPPLLPLRRP